MQQNRKWVAHNTNEQIHAVALTDADGEKRHPPLLIIGDDEWPARFFCRPTDPWLDL